MNAPTPHPAHDLGRWGESLAARCLARSGWRVLARNYRLGRREVDLVIEQDGLLVFVEVKTRSGAGFGEPELAVTWKKRREIEVVASGFMQRYRGDVRGVRFDVVSIVVGPGRSIVRFEHIQDGWRPSG